MYVKIISINQEIDWANANNAPRYAGTGPPPAPEQGRPQPQPRGPWRQLQQAGRGPRVNGVPQLHTELYQQLRVHRILLLK